VRPKWGTRFTQLVAHNCNAAVEIVVGDPIEEVSGAKRGRIDHTVINPRACPRTCKHSFSAVISSGWLVEHAKGYYSFSDGRKRPLCAQWGLGAGHPMLREVVAVGSFRTCIAFISLGDGRANVPSIQFHPSHWNRSQPLGDGSLRAATKTKMKEW
jgi:hypothetical protein